MEGEKKEGQKSHQERKKKTELLGTKTKLDPNIIKWNIYSVLKWNIYSQSNDEKLSIVILKPET